MHLLKQCPRCHGDLIADRDQYGDFVSCLQCGLCQDIQVGDSGSPVVTMKSGHLLAAAASSGEGYRTNTLLEPAVRSPEALTA